jgi:hypothetical protein
VQANRHALPHLTWQISRLLSSRTPPAEAARFFQDITRNGRLLRLLDGAPHHRVGPALRARVAGLERPPGSAVLRLTLDRLDYLTARCALRAQLLRRQLHQVVSVLAGRGVEACLIKGAASLVDDVPPGLLPASVREMEDIDVVVRRGDGAAARAAMAERGWLCVSGRQAVPFRIDAPALVDVHEWAPGAPALGALRQEAFFAAAPRAETGGCGVAVLPARHQVPLRLAHNVIRQHLFIDFPLLDLWELAEAVSAGPDAIDWGHVRRLGLRHGVARIFYAVLDRLRDEWGAPVPARAVPAAERPAAARERRRLECLATVPGWLYGAASRAALIGATPGDWRDRLSRAYDVLLDRPLSERGRGGAVAGALLPARMLGLHAAAWAWRMLGT